MAFGVGMRRGAVWRDQRDRCCGGLSRQTERNALRQSSVEEPTLCLRLMEIGTEPSKNPVTVNSPEK